MFSVVKLKLAFDVNHFRMSPSWYQDEPAPSRTQLPSVSHKFKCGLVQAEDAQ